LLESLEAEDENWDNMSEEMKLEVAEQECEVKEESHQVRQQDAETGKQNE